MIDIGCRKRVIGMAVEGQGTIEMSQARHSIRLLTPQDIPSGVRMTGQGAGAVTEVRRTASCLTRLPQQAQIWPGSWVRSTCRNKREVLQGALGQCAPVPRFASLLLKPTCTRACPSRTPPPQTPPCAPPDLVRVLACACRPC